MRVNYFSPNSFIIIDFPKYKSLIGPITFIKKFDVFPHLGIISTRLNPLQRTYLELKEAPELRPSVLCCPLAEEGL